MDPLGLKIILFTCLVFVPLERLLALNGEQKILRPGLANDLTFLLLNGLVIKLGMFTVMVTSLLVAAWIVPAFVQDTVGGLSFWIQIPLVILLSDLGVYWIHRMFHAVPWLWRFHEIHHSSEELDWLVTVRAHPVDQILTKGAPLVIVIVLGFSAWSISVYALLSYWHAFLVHANVRIGFGPLRLLLVSPAFHHWHHSSDREARDRNFAAQLSFLDALFGTLHMPRGRMPTAYGLDRPMRQRYILQMLYPFVGDRERQYLPAEAEPVTANLGSSAQASLTHRPLS